MKNYRYLFARIREMDYANMIHIAGKVAKKAGKSRLAILCDMVRCGFKYQAGYYDYQEFEFYNLTAKQRETYLTRGKNNEIVRRFNDQSKFHTFENKDEFYTAFDAFIKREWIKLDGSDYERFYDFFKKNGDIIVKIVNGSGGDGIEKFSFKDYTDDVSVRALYDKLIENEQFLVEQCIVQHDEMSGLYGDSVNTLRVYSFFDGEKAHLLYAVMKLGNGGVVDNFCSGGMYTFVDEEGYVYVGAIDQDDNIFYEHPITKKKIVGFKVPMYEQLEELIDKAGRVVPEVRYVGWDVAIGKDGPIIIEGNCFPGVYQMKASFSENKVGLIPKYEKVMKIKAGKPIAG